MLKVTVGWESPQEQDDPYLAPPAAADPEGLSPAQLRLLRRRAGDAARRRALVELDAKRAASYGITWNLPEDSR